MCTLLHMPTNMEGVPHTHTHTHTDTLPPVLSHTLLNNSTCYPFWLTRAFRQHRPLEGALFITQVLTASDKWQENDTAREVLSPSVGYACVWVSQVLLRWCSYFKMGVATCFLSPLAKYTYILLLKECGEGVRWESRFLVVPLIVLEEMKKVFYCTHEKNVIPSFFVDTCLGGFTRSWVSPCCPQTSCSQELSFCFNLVSEKRLWSLFSPQRTLLLLP